MNLWLFWIIKTAILTLRVQGGANQAGIFLQRRRSDKPFGVKGIMQQMLTNYPVGRFKN